MSNKIFLKELSLIQKKLTKEDPHSLDYFPQQIERYLKNYNHIKNFITKKDKILDIGCSPFHFTSCLKRLGYEITGVDKTPKNNKQFITSENLNIIECDIEKEKLPFDDDSFDVVLFLEVFEHLHTNSLFALKEIKRILKKEGILIFATPNAYSPKRMLHFFLGRGLGDDPYELAQSLEKLGYHGHVREYAFKELEIFLKNVGFKIEKVFFEYYGPYKFRNRPLMKLLSKLFFEIFVNFRSGMIIIAKKPIT